MIELTKTHALKTWPEYYWPVVSGAKPFEIRQNDRAYKVGEYVELKEWDPAIFDAQMRGKDLGDQAVVEQATQAAYSGNSELFTITYITDFAQQPGYVVMGIKPVRFVQTAPKTMASLMGQAQRDLGGRVRISGDFDTEVGE